MLPVLNDGTNVARMTMRTFLWLLVLIPIAFAYGRELYPGQYAQVPPEIQEWFRTQKIPGTQATCCSESDGVHGEQDVRYGKYWARFVIEYHAYDCAASNPSGCLDKGIKMEQVDWVPVPEHVIIRNTPTSILLFGGCGRRACPMAFASGVTFQPRTHDNPADTMELELVPPTQNKFPHDSQGRRLTKFMTSAKVPLLLLQTFRNRGG